jgi:hypothetical protein
MSMIRSAVRSSATASGCGSAAIKVFMAYPSQAGAGSARLARVAMPELVRERASVRGEFSAYGWLLIF